MPLSTRGRKFCGSWPVIIYMRAGGSKPAYLEFSKRAVGKEQLAFSPAKAELSRKLRAFAQSL
jgi:hypothetical protein